MIVGIILSIVVIGGIWLLNRPLFHLKKSFFEFEYGQTVSLEAIDYLNVEDMDDEEIDDLLKNIEVSSSIKNEEGKNYPAVGNYTITFQYAHQKRKVDIEVKDTTAPTVYCPQYIQILEGEALTDELLSTYFTCSDLSEFTFDIDTSQYDISKIGKQTITLKAYDVYENECVQDYQIETIEKPNEKFYDTKTVINKNDQGQIANVNVELIEKKFAFDITLYCQHDVGARMGCDPTALYIALRYKGYCQDLDLKSFIEDMPISPDNDPRNGFAGSPWTKGKANILEMIYPSAIASWAQKYAPVSDFSGHSVNDIITELRKGNIVMVYTVHYFGVPDWRDWFFDRMYNNVHCLVVSGYDPQGHKIRVSDPGARRASYWVDLDTFTTSYNYKKFSVLVE